MKSRLITLFMLVGIIPLAASVFIGHMQAKYALKQVEEKVNNDVEKLITEQLRSLRDINRDRIEKYFQTIKDQVLTFSEDRMIVDAMREFKTHFKNYRTEQNLDASQLNVMREKLVTYYTNDYSNEYKNRNGKTPDNISQYYTTLDEDSVALQYSYIKNNNNPLGSKDLLDSADESSYSKLHQKIHPVVRSFLKKFGYYDIFLVDSETGDIVYSVFKELDYSTSLNNGPYSGTNFGRAFQEANRLTSSEDYVLVDFEQYSPSYEDPASFIASPIFDKGKKIGVAIFQMPLDRISEVMSQRAGLGNSGEIYLVGEDKKLRSDSHLNKSHDEEYTVVTSFRENKLIDTESVSKAFNDGDEGGIIIGPTYHQLEKEYLSSYSPVKLSDSIQWAIIAEIGTNEAFKLVEDIKGESDKNQNAFFLFSGILFIIAAGAIIAIALFVAGRITKPLIAAVTNLSSAASDISTATTQLAASGAETATSISETSAAVEEVRQTANISNEKAQSVAHDATKTVDYSETGNQAVTETIEGMEQIQSRMEVIADSIVHLSEQCQAISEIITSINNLAEQSNLLAVNASIEAAKAGEEGKGFAVVAQEVRTLAEQSKEATSQIQNILTDIQKATTEAVMATEEGGKAVAKGVDLSKQAGQSIEFLFESINSAAQAATQIAASSQQQLVGMDQMASAMDNINQATSQNVESARQVEDAARGLDQLSKNIKSLVYSSNSNQSYRGSEIKE